MNLSVSELEKIELKYGYLVNETYSTDLKIGHARTILDVIYNHYKSNPSIQAEFSRAVEQQKERFAKNKKREGYAPYEDPIKNSTSGWLNFFVKKEYIPIQYKKSFEFIYEEVSESIHGGDSIEAILAGTVARLNEIIRWVFSLHNRPTDFLQEVKISNKSQRSLENPNEEILNVNAEELKPPLENSGKRSLWSKSLFVTVAILLLGFFTYQLFWSLSPREGLEDNTILPVHTDQNSEGEKLKSPKDSSALNPMDNRDTKIVEDTKNCCQEIAEVGQRLLGIINNNQSIEGIPLEQLKKEVNDFILNSSNCNRSDCAHNELYQELFNKGKIFSQRLLAIEEAYIDIDNIEVVSPKAKEVQERSRLTYTLLGYLCKHIHCSQTEIATIEQLQKQYSLL